MKIIAGISPNWQTTAVYLDGERLRGCIEADDVAGVVLYHDGETRGGVWLPKAHVCECGDCHPVVVEKRGKVEFRTT